MPENNEQIAKIRQLLHSLWGYAQDETEEAEQYGDIEKVQAFIDLALKDQLEAGKKCPWCGSNDLVCGKAWKEEREGLLGKVEAVNEENEEIRKLIPIENCEAMVDAWKKAAEALQKHYNYCDCRDADVHVIQDEG